jgi:hypothetical protein
MQQNTYYNRTLSNNECLKYRLCNNTTKNHKQIEENAHKKEWITLIYFRHGTKEIIKIFKDTEIKISLQMNNTAQKRKTTRERL